MRKRILETLKWMIAHFDHEKEMSGLDSEDSAEIKEAKELVSVLELEVCRWCQDEEGGWMSECGMSFNFIDYNTPLDSGFLFCPGCGREMEVVECRA